MIIWVILAFLLGVIITLIVMSRLDAGVLKVYIPDDEQPYLYVELNKPVSFICSKKRVSFTVDTKNIHSQE